MPTEQQGMKISRKKNLHPCMYRQQNYTVYRMSHDDERKKNLWLFFFFVRFSCECVCVNTTNDSRYERVLCIFCAYVSLNHVKMAIKVTVKFSPIFFLSKFFFILFSLGSMYVGFCVLAFFLSFFLAFCTLSFFVCKWVFFPLCFCTFNSICLVSCWWFFFSFAFATKKCVYLM